MSRFHDRFRLRGREWEDLRRAVLDAANWRCAGCGGYANEVDHIVPLHKRGAPRDPANLQALCGGCHGAKTRSENRREPTEAEAAWRAFAAELLDNPGR